MKNPFKKFDNFFINLINRRLKNKVLDVFFFYFTNLGGVTFLSLLSLGLLIFGQGNVRSLGLEIVSALLFSGLIVQVLKRIFNRNRPYWILSNLNTFGLDLSDYSFPSGHSTASFSLATILALNYPQYIVIIYFVATLVSVSRIYLAVHYPTDVVAGITLGIISGLFVHNYLYPYLLDAFNIKFSI